jgi:hypothetical protein
MGGYKEAPRRRASRLSTRLDGQLSGRRPQDVTVLDLSLTGCLVRCGARPERGTVLDLTLSLEAETLTVKVRVADSSVDGSSLPDAMPGFLAGLEFLSVPAQQLGRLRQFLDAEERRRRSADAPPS